MLACDVTDDESVAKLVDRVVAEARRIDLLVNNAGISAPCLPPYLRLTGRGRYRIPAKVVFDGLCKQGFERAPLSDDL